MCVWWSTTDDDDDEEERSKRVTIRTNTSFIITVDFRSCLFISDLLRQNQDGREIES